MWIIDDIMNVEAQSQQNEKNRQEARLAGEQDRIFSAQEAAKAREFNSLEARKAREFEQNMSSTAHSRAVADLKNAGLNPLLAATGGATTPGASAASGPAASAHQVASQGQAALLNATGALELMDFGLRAEKQKAELAYIESNTARNKVESRVKEKEAWKGDLSEAIVNKVKEFVNTNARDYKPEWKPESEDKTPFRFGR